MKKILAILLFVVFWTSLKAQDSIPFYQITKFYKTTVFEDTSYHYKPIIVNGHIDVDSIGIGGIYLSEFDTSGNISVDTLSVNVIEMGSETATGFVDSKAVMEGTETDSLTTGKIINGVTSISANKYNTLSTDYYLHVEYTSTDTVLVTIDNSNKITGANLLIKDAEGNAGTNKIRITPESGTIDGASSVIINNNYGLVSMYSDGSNWFIKYILD